MPDEGVAFDAIAAEFFSVWFRYHPDVAAAAGVRGYEHLLPAQTDDELAALGAWLETLVVALEEIDYRLLDGDRRIDLRLMFGAARVEHQELLERDWRHRDPLRFLPVAEIYHLTLRPPPNIREVLAMLLRAVPDYLRLALSHLRSMAELVAPVMVDAAIDEAERGRCYLRELVASPWLRRHCYTLSEIEGLVDAACSALAAFAAALRDEIGGRAAGRLGCGLEHLRFLVRHRHFMHLDVKGARGALVAALAGCQEETAELCASLRTTPEGALVHLREPVLEGSHRVDLCRAESDRLARILARAGLVTLPDAELRLRERLSCPRPQRFSTEYVADREAQSGTYFLGEAPSGDSHETLASLRWGCFEQTWGGRHLFAFAAKEPGWRLPRRFCADASLTGAWSIYFRDRLGPMGLLEPEERLQNLLSKRAAIERGLLDLDLHLGEIGEEDARARVAEIPGSDLTDLLRIARHPGDALAGVLGWLLLVKARKQEEARMGGGFDERAFHDGLLGYGTIPLPLILDQELGGDLSQEIAA